MRKSILFASFAVVSLSLYGMQDGFNSEMNAEKTNSRLSLALSDVSDFQDTVFNKKESSSSSIQWNIFESEDKGDQKVQGDFSDSSDMESIPSVSEIFEKILNPKVKTEQSEVCRI